MFRFMRNDNFGRTLAVNQLYTYAKLISWQYLKKGCEKNQLENQEKIANFPIPSGSELDYGIQWQFIVGWGGKLHQSEIVSPASAGRIKSSSMRALIAFWKSLICIPQAKAILAILFGPSSTLNIFDILWSIPSSSSGTSPEHRKTRIVAFSFLF